MISSRESCVTRYGAMVSSSRDLKVLVLHTLPPAECGSGRSPEEFALTEGAEHVASVLEHASVACVLGEAAEIVTLVEAQRPDVVFNLCEAPLGRPGLESHAAALLEWMGIAFTGSGSETLALCRRKPWMNAVLAAHGVAVPRAGVFPAIVKPADEDGSAGISADSVCADGDAVERARARCPGPVVIEEFAPGREFAVSLWGRTAPEYVSIGETLFQNGLRLNTYAAKWDSESAEFADSPLDYTTEMEPSLREHIVAAARGAWHAAGARGYLRIDIRCNTQGIPVVLDVNPNPAVGPGIGICRAVEEAGWTWECFVRRQVEWAYDR
jgi:D-alanine-D-alanine ligase